MTNRRRNLFGTDTSLESRLMLHHTGFPHSHDGAEFEAEAVEVEQTEVADTNEANDDSQSQEDNRQARRQARRAARIAARIAARANN